jgi:protein-tyrosine phosphatase
MGNICRSPAAEGVLQGLVDQRGLTDVYEIDSAGTIGYHAGEPADERMRRAASRRGHSLRSRARSVTRQDFRRFDHILALDRANLIELQSIDPGGSDGAELRLLCDFHPDEKMRDVPDPYYGGAEGFERVLDIIETACANLLDHLENSRGAGSGR